MQRAKRVGWMKLLDVLTEISCECVQKYGYYCASSRLSSNSMQTQKLRVYIPLRTDF